jgi:phosphoserine phosphatase
LNENGEMARLEGLVLFDLDGTLLRGQTVCEVMAYLLGRLGEMKRFEGLTGRAEIAAARMEMRQAGVHVAMARVFIR